MATTAYSKPAKALIEAAERLIATEGLGVALREIGQAAGAANKVAVQYHFGDRAKLIEAVFHYRLPLLEERRAAMLADAERGGAQPTMAALIEMLMRPIAEIRDAQGRARFAGFLYQLTANARSVRAEFEDIAPVAKLLVERILLAAPSELRPLARQRLGSASLVYLDTLVRFDDRGELDERAVAEALSLALAVLCAPIWSGRRSAR